MSQEQLKAFLEKLKGDIGLQNKLKSAKSPEEVIGIAKEHIHSSGDKTSLTDAELEYISGGHHDGRCSAISNCGDNTGEGPGG